MSHKSGSIIINRASGTEGIVSDASIALEFPAGTSVEDKLKKVRQVERLLDKLDHEDDEG